MQLQGVSSLGPFPTARKAPSPKWDVPTLAPPVDNLDIRYIRPLWPLGPPSFSFGMGWLEGNSRFHMRMWTFVVCICLCVYLVLLWFHTRRNKANSGVNLCGHHILPRSESSNPEVTTMPHIQKRQIWAVPEVTSKTGHVDESIILIFHEFLLAKKMPCKDLKKKNITFWQQINKHHNSPPHLPGVGKTELGAPNSSNCVTAPSLGVKRPQFQVPSEPPLRHKKWKPI